MPCDFESVGQRKNDAESQLGGHDVNPEVAAKLCLKSENVAVYLHLKLAQFHNLSQRNLEVMVTQCTAHRESVLPQIRGTRR